MDFSGTRRILNGCKFSSKERTQCARKAEDAADEAAGCNETTDDDDQKDKELFWPPHPYRFSWFLRWTRIVWNRAESQRLREESVCPVPDMNGVYSNDRACA